ncbi:MAG: hypothetical protein IKP54_08520 [Bacteroidales bacterium]|nr:hypothetical protein [Bacteroidales bacterium]
MEKIIIDNYIGNGLSANDPGKVLAYYHQQYPCSNVMTLLYLKMLEEDRPKEYEKVKSTLLLSIPNRDRFHQFQLSNQPLYAGHTHNAGTIEDKTGTAEGKATTVEKNTVKAPIEKTDEEPVTPSTSVIDEVKKLINSTGTEARPSSIEEEMGMEKTFEAPTINLEEDQSVVIDSLIAKFGGNPSTIKRAVKILEPLANYSEGSLDEDEEIVSKTLAIIYAEQGYNGKAIKMLKKLSLIFPEKSSIFASHIEMIKNGKYNQIN